MLTLPLVDCEGEEFGFQGAVEKIAVFISWKSELLIEGPEERCRGNDD